MTPWDNDDSDDGLDPDLIRAEVRSRHVDASASSERGKARLNERAKDSNDLELLERGSRSWVSDAPGANMLSFDELRVRANAPCVCS